MTPETKWSQIDLSLAENAVEQLRLFLEYLTPEQRRIVFEAVAEGYCRDCGCSLNVAARCPNMDCPTE